jgi:hypothetical protein
MQFSPVVAVPAEMTAAPVPSPTRGAAASNSNSLTSPPSVSGSWRGLWMLRRRRHRQFTFALETHIMNSETAHLLHEADVALKKYRVAVARDAGGLVAEAKQECLRLYTALLKSKTDEAVLGAIRKAMAAPMRW